jgi:hypothetical protein
MVKLDYCTFCNQGLKTVSNRTNIAYNQAFETAQSNVFSNMIPSLGSKIPKKRNLIIKQSILAGMCLGALFGSSKVQQENIKNPSFFNKEATTTFLGITNGAAATGLYCSLVWLITYILFYEQFALSHEANKVGIEKLNIVKGGPSYDELEQEMTEFVKFGSTVQKWIEGWTITTTVLFFVSLTLSSPFSFLLGHSGYMLFQRYLILNAKQGAEQKLKAIDHFTGKKAM